MDRRRGISESFFAGYRKLNYLESSGTQWIDTGINPDGYTGIDIKYETTLSSYGNQFLFGAGDNTGGSSNEISCNIYNNNVRCHYNSQGFYDSTITMLTTHTYKLTNYIAYNDNTVIHTYTFSSFTQSRSMYLFGANRGGTECFTGRIYYFKVYKSSVIVGDFIPALRNSDDKPGFYDTISKTFFTNKGSGEFLYG